MRDPPAGFRRVIPIRFNLVEVRLRKALCMRNGQQLRQIARRAGAAACCTLVAAATALAADQVTINLTGTITPACALSGINPTAALGNVAAAGAVSIPFTIDCNAPFTYALSSANGGLAHQSVTTASGGFAIAVPYAVQTVIATNSGAGIDQTCTSASIKTGAVSCAFTNSGTAVAIQKAGSLGLTWAASSLPLVAGTYQDTLTLTVSVQP